MYTLGGMKFMMVIW